MERRSFGWTRELVPVIGQGTWRMERGDRATVVTAIRKGLDAGVTHVDTAEIYGDGAVEELVGEAIAGRRDEVFLASKVAPRNASYEGTLRACEQSLRRLRTDRLDLYMLHWPSAEPLEGTIRAFDALREQGKIRFWGVSNFDVPELDEALAIAGEGAIACNQLLYHLNERGIEHRVIPWCEEHGVAVVGYSPFGSGHFPGGAVLDEIARAHGVTPRQVALAFLIRRPSLFTIPKAATPEHGVDNAAAGDLRLTAEEIRAIDQAFPLGDYDESEGLPTI